MTDRAEPREKVNEPAERSVVSTGIPGSGPANGADIGGSLTSSAAGSSVPDTSGQAHPLSSTPADSGGVPSSECICYPGMCPMGCEPACPYCFQAPARSGLPAVREPDEPLEMTAEEVERALQIGPPDFLLGEGFDAENGPGASDELRGLGEENARG